MLTSAKNLNLTLPGNTPSSAASQSYARIDKMTAKQNTGMSRLTDSLNQDKTKLSSLGQIQSLLTQFQSLAQGISASGLASSASSSSPAAEVQITGSVTPGQYHVQIKQLASAQTLATPAQKSSSAPIGSGAATQISVVSGNPQSTKIISISIGSGSGNNSLQGIAAALKAAGIDASIQTAANGKGYSLTLASGLGASQQMQISVKGDATLKALLSFNPANSRNGMTQTGAAQDSIISVNGKTLRSDSNTLHDAIPGTTLEIRKTGSSDIAISQDNSQIKQHITSFVAAYNQLISQIGSLHGNAPAAASATQVKSQLDQIVKSLPQGSAALNQIGIQLANNGSMTLDSGQLERALHNSADKVNQLFSHQGRGIADLLSSGISQLTGSHGSLQKDIDATSKDIDSLSAKRDALSKTTSKQNNPLVNQYSQQAGNTGGKGLSLFDYFV